MADNPLLVESGARDAAVPFGQIKTEHFLPALKQAIEESKSRIDLISAAGSPPDFENTIEALETSSDLVDHVSAVFYNLLNAESNDELHEIGKEFAPRLADFSSDVLLNEELFRSVKSVYDHRESLRLNAEAARLLEKTFKNFKRNGALLDPVAKEKLREIDRELSALQVQFGERVLKATNAFQHVITDPKRLDGLPVSAIEAAAATAREKGKDGAWMFTLHAPSYVPYMTYASDAAGRETLWKAYNSRSFGGDFDNQDSVKRLASLRYERARILGYDAHAHFVLEERMAEHPSRVQTFLRRLLGVYKKAAEKDLDELRRFRQNLEGVDRIEPWDFAYYQEKLKKLKFDFDQEALRPYFKLDRVIAGLFEHAARLYGLRFDPVRDVPVYHPDVTVFEVRDERRNEYLGLFYADFYPRDSKKGGAWMTTFRDQGLWAGRIRRPHVSIVANLTKPTPTKPSLLTFDEVQTIFHEFGHSLHALLSKCRYRSLGGTNVYWDFVELPSQVMENWTYEKASLDIYASHDDTGEPIPANLAQKIKDSAKFFAGSFSLRQINFALLDMAWHSGDPGSVADINAFEIEATRESTILPRVPGTNFSCSFSHVFNGGYSSGYYSYKWAEVLDADAFELFKEKGLFNREVADRFRTFILEKGGSEPPMELYKSFRDREPDPDALLRREGLIDQVRFRTIGESAGE